MARSHTHIYTCDRHGRIPLSILLVGGRRGENIRYIHSIGSQSTLPIGKYQRSPSSSPHEAGGRPRRQAGRQAKGKERKGKESPCVNELQHIGVFLPPSYILHICVLYIKGWQYVCIWNVMQVSAEGTADLFPVLYSTISYGRRPCRGGRPESAPLSRLLGT